MRSLRRQASPKPRLAGRLPVWNMSEPYSRSFSEKTSREIAVCGADSLGSKSILFPRSCGDGLSNTYTCP